MPAPTSRPLLLDPKNDFVFKKLLADAPTLLAALINAVRHPRPAVTVVDILNPVITPEELEGKFIVLDVLAEDQLGQRHDVEMQSRPFPAWGARSVYYLARTLARQLDAGHEYTRLRPAIGIHLLDFALYDDEDSTQQAAWCFELRDGRRPTVRLGPELELHLIELPKARRLRRLGYEPALAGALGAWIDFFEHWNDEERMAGIDEPAVRQALVRLHDLSADEEARRMAFVRMRALRDERAIRLGEREAGRAEGEIILLLRLLEQRFGPIPATAIARLRRATPEECAGVADRMLRAASLVEALGPVAT
jgi:predicted transposase/invertase (TIGR01784 family)